MPRLRINNVGDPTGATNPITISSSTATSCSWVSAPTNVPTVASPNYLSLIIEPGTQNEEVIWVTAYTAGATTATISRGHENTQAITHSSTAWLHGITADDFITISPTGLLGANAATRYVGGTTFGAPTAGSFVVGDFVIDQSGRVWICTTAGSPGTWTTISLPTVPFDKEWAISNVPLVTVNDEDPYPGVLIRVPAGVTTVLYGVVGVAPYAGTFPTFKLRRFTAGAWGDIAGYGTTAAPLSASSTTNVAYTTPGNVTLVDGDILGLWVVSAGVGATGLRVSALINTTL